MMRGRTKRAQKVVSKLLTKSDLRRALEDELPNVVVRTKFEEYGLPYASGYMANLDSAGEGPGVLHIGGRACYIKGPLIEWMLNKCDLPEG